MPTYFLWIWLIGVPLVLAVVDFVGLRRESGHRAVPLTTGTQSQVP